MSQSLHSRPAIRIMLIIGILAMAFSVSFLIRSQGLNYGHELNEFDPFFNYRATSFMVDNGIPAYLEWHDEMSWYPNGRDISSSSQVVLHYTAALTYQAFGFGSSLYDFTIMFPVIFGSLTAVAVFALVRVIGGTTAGLFASMLFAISAPIITRGTVGWFKSEPLGLFYGILGVYLFLSAIKSGRRHESILRMAGAGLFLTFGVSAWGGIQFFILPIGIFILALPFLRTDHKFQMWCIPIFTASLLSSTLLFERPGTAFITGLGGFAIVGPTLFLVICNAIQMKSEEAKKLRNGLMLLGGMIGGGAAFVMASFSTNLLGLPSYRYLNALNPFLTTQDPLVDSVAEHATTTLQQSFFFLSILMVFAALGVWLILQSRRTSKSIDMYAFALIIGIVGVYTSSAFVRLEIFASIAVIILGSVGLARIFQNMFDPETKSGIHSVRWLKPALAGGICALLVVPLVAPAQGNWITIGDAPPTLLNGGASFRIVAQDWPDALEWLRTSTPEGSIVASWWDYGYWITTISNRTTFADNATIDTEAIQSIARMFLAPPDKSWQMLQDMDADYVLIFVVAHALQAESSEPLYSLRGGGDESKKQWFIRIAADDPESKYLHSDGLSGTEHFWSETMLGQMFPFSPVIYFDPITTLQSSTYLEGYLPVYTKDIKMPFDGDGPVQLAYVSPSFSNNSDLILGVIIYKVNDSYVPVAAG